ncbi:MAG: DUF1707 domain-containing protein [Solirubrobacteraceae bacterium]
MEQPPQPPSVLASDADRERSVEVLRQAVADGRLELEEFTDRVGLAHASRTEAELAVLTRDLPDRASQTAEESPRYLALCSRLIRKGRWDLARRSSFRSIFGTIDLDLRQARLASEDVEIDLFNLFGTVTVIVPEGIEVTVTGGGAFASQVIDPPAGPPIPGAPRLRINGRGPGGTLYVRSRSEHGGVMTRALGGDEST